MKLRRFIIFLFIIILTISLKLPDVYRHLDIPVNSIDAEAEVGSIEEFEAAILDALVEVKDSARIRIESYDEKAYDINTAFKAVLSENAGLGFVSGCRSTITRTFGRQYADVLLEFQYSVPRENIADMRAESDRAAGDIIEKIIKPGMSEYEKVLAVHDHIIKSSRYDRLNADSGNVPAEEHEAYGVLVKGIGVCDSYAKAVKLLLDKAGVKCMLVEGSKADTAAPYSENTDHGWNIVSIDGEYYHLDATWDDSGEERDSSELLYHYLNLNDQEMQKTHVWDRSKYPACTGTKYNYFRYNGLIAENHNEMLSMLIKALSGKGKKLTVRIADYNSSAYDIEALIKKAAGRSGLKHGIGAKWMINDSLGIIDIEFEY